MSRKKSLNYPMDEGTYKVPNNIPEKKYGCIVIDAPWRTNQVGTHHTASNIYPVLHTEEIMALPVPELLKDDAFVWMWVNNGLIGDAVKILEHWGLRILGVLTWAKPSFALGNYLRNASEQCILAAKGKPKFKCHSQASVLYAPNMGHSVKPDEIFVIAERCTDGPYLEMFARRIYNQERWDVWGDSVTSDIYIPGYPVPTYSFDRSFRDDSQTPETKMQRLEEAKRKRRRSRKVAMAQTSSKAGAIAKEPTKEVVPSDTGKPVANPTTNLPYGLYLGSVTQDGTRHPKEHYSGSNHGGLPSDARVDNHPNHQALQRPMGPLAS